MSESIDILINYIDRQWSQAQQSENQRATITNYVLVMCGAIQGFIVQRSFDLPSLALAFFMILLGILGLLTTIKYYERFRFAASHVGRAMKELKNICPDVDLDEIENKSKALHNKRYPQLSKLRLNWLWQLLHCCIILVGLINVVIICLRLTWKP